MEKEVGGYFRQMGSDEPAQQAFFRVQAAIERITEALIQTPLERQELMIELIEAAARGEVYTATEKHIRGLEANDRLQKVKLAA